VSGAGIAASGAGIAVSGAGIAASGAAGLDGVSSLSLVIGWCSLSLVASSAFCSALVKQRVFVLVFVLVFVFVFVALITLAR
jgi:hypothetical protein